MIPLLLIAAAIACVAAGVRQTDEDRMIVGGALIALATLLLAVAFV